MLFRSVSQSRYHLRYVLEWGATQGNGAEVNIDQVKTSFWNLSLTISNVQVTNAEIPSQNIVAFDVLNFQMTMDALLRGKIVIEDASLMGLRFNSKRGKIGYVLPPKPIDPKSEEPSPMMRAVLKQRDLWVKNEFESSILSDVVALLQSDDLKEALNDSLKELKSQEQIDQLLQEWPEKRKLWESKLVVLKEKNTVEKLYQQAKDIKPSKEPKEILDQLKQVQEIRKKAKIEYDSYKNDYVSLTQDVTTFKNRVNSLPDLVKQDLDAIKQKLKIPTLDAKKSGQEIFQRLIYQYTGPYVPYLEKARPYWESSKKAKTERPKPASRGQGINVHFSITKGYPTFWLKKMILPSDTKKTVATDHKYALQGELKNVTTRPKVINAPIELALKGDLLSQEILGIDSLLSMDLRDNFIVRASLDIASLPVKEFSLAKSSKLQLALEQAKAKLSLAMIFAKGEMDFKTRIDLSENLWGVQTEKEAVTSSVKNSTNKQKI